MTTTETVFGPQLLMDLNQEHEFLKCALKNTAQHFQPKSVCGQPFEQPSAEQVNACLHWLEMASGLQAILTGGWLDQEPRESNSLYYWKHAVEDSTGLYVTTDALACAALTAEELSTYFFCRHLKFRMHRTDDAGEWMLLFTPPCSHFLNHLAGRHLRNEPNLRVNWDTSDSGVEVTA